jgi:hypothetical protein
MRMPTMQDRWPWRDRLTPDERDTLENLDRQIGRYAAKIKAARYERKVLVSRARMRTTRDS